MGLSQLLKSRFWSQDSKTEAQHMEIVYIWCFFFPEKGICQLYEPDLYGLTDTLL